MSIVHDIDVLKKQNRALAESLAAAQRAEREAVERAKAAEDSARRAWRLANERTWGNRRPESEQ